MLHILNVKFQINYKQEDILTKAAKLLKINKNVIKSAKIYKRSLDARNKKNIHYICTLEVNLKVNEDKILAKIKDKNIIKFNEDNFKIKKYKACSPRPIVVGFGPGGMFAGLLLAKAGFKPIIIERGKEIAKRQKDINIFWQGGPLDENSNVQFGEGGAGAFSDGKLNTGIKSKYIRFILKTFVENSAPEDILIEAKPHIGTDNLKSVVRNIRNKIIDLGGEVLFEHTLVDIKLDVNRSVKSILVENNNKLKEIFTENIILSIGHSARDTFEMLYKNNVLMQSKAFSIGVRIEHPQELINKAMFGNLCKKLPPASYKLACHLENKRGVYSFCMCPGGKVVASSSEKGYLVTNGMSNFARDNTNANSALLVNVTTKDFNSDLPLSGVEFQRKWEKKAFELGGGNYFAPVQTVGDFLNDKITTCLGKVKPSYKPNYKFANLKNCLPEFAVSSLKEGILHFDKKISGFAMPDAILTGVETRSSSPVRILRLENGMSANTIGLYPCAEGAGYAGGIMSSAVDGINSALKLIKNLN